MQSSIRMLQSIIDNEAREFAMYTVEDRAIPSMIDGFKPVQRFFMYRALLAAKANKTKFNKVAAVGGGVSEAGYHHGEESASSAGKLMANTWNNNIPVLEGDGNFGSRLVQKAAASRYVFCRVHDNFWDIYKDTEMAPAHEDPEHLPPKFYLPVIPMVLANGVKGIATGYATDIFPHSKASLIECTELAIKGKLNKEPELLFPEFKGTIRPNGQGGIFLEGKYHIVGKTKLIITELPIKYDREKYVEILDKLEDQGKIVGYKDQCGEHGFQFEVTLKRNEIIFGEESEERHELIMKTFNLRQSMTQNITVLDEHGKLREYDKASDLINDFVKIRIQYIEKRIDFQAQKAEYNAALATAKVEFIEKILDGTIVIQGKKRADALADIKTHEGLKHFAEELIGMSIYRITSDELEKLRKEASEQTKLHQYWLKTTPQKEYMKDLKF